MQKLDEKVDAIEQKVRRIIHLYENLKRENELLLKENNRIKEELNQYIDKIEGLQNAVKETTSTGISNKVVFKQRINQLAEELDECIEMLNS